MAVANLSFWMWKQTLESQSDGMNAYYRWLQNVSECNLPSIERYNGDPAQENELLDYIFGGKVVSELNCTVVFRFESPGPHLLTDFQAKLESELFCAVTAHVYVSMENVHALDIHTDPYDVFVLQLQGRKRWKVCLPRPIQAEISDARTCRGQADRALRREMQGWNGMGGTNFAPGELESMDCEYTETQPADTLYIPRSFVHVAEASSEEPSMHITFGLQENGHRWKDFLVEAIKSVVCFARCDEQVVNLLQDATREMASSKRGTHLTSSRYKLYQAFPLRKCSTALPPTWK